MRTFHRSRRERWLGGVCAGLAEITPVPAWGWRLAFALLTIYFGTGLLLYILLWVFVPLEAADEPRV